MAATNGIPAATCQLIVLVVVCRVVLIEDFILLFLFFVFSEVMCGPIPISTFYWVTSSKYAEKKILCSLFSGANLQPIFGKTRAFSNFFNFGL